MRKLIILILLIGGAAKVSADCTQADLAGWWELSANNLSCSFLLDVAGTITKGNCWQAYGSASGGKLAGKRPILNDTFINNQSGIVSEVKLGEHCTVKGGLLASVYTSSYGDRYIAWMLSGRINLEKSFVSGTSKVYLENDSSPFDPFKLRDYFATYTMVKF